MAIDFQNIQEMIKEEVSFAGKQDTGESLTTTYRFRTMGAVQGWDVMLRVREAVGQILDTDIVTTSQAEAIVMAVFKLPTPFVRQLQAEMFMFVDFANEKTAHQRVSDATEMAFEGQRPSVIAEVLARSLCVNFSDSLTDLFGET